MHASTCAQRFDWQHFPSSMAESDEHLAQAGPGGKWPGAVLEQSKVAASTYLTTSADIIGSLGSLLLRGDTLYAPFPLARASLERTTTIIWLLDPDLAPRHRAARAWLDQFNAYDHAIVSTRDAPTRAAIKRNRKAIRSSLGDWFHNPSELTVDPSDPSGTVSAVALFGESYPTFGTRFDRTEALMGWSKFGRTYDALSGFSHPNVELERILETGGTRSVDVEGIERLVQNTISAHLAAQAHVRGYMGWPSGPFVPYEAKLESLLPGLFA